MQDDKIKKIFHDENGKVQFDFSDAVNVFEPHDLSNLYSDYLSDVDFVLEEKEKLICLEYKNANIKNADNPKAFQQKLAEEAFWKKQLKSFMERCFLSGHAIKSIGETSAVCFADRKQPWYG